VLLEELLIPQAVKKFPSFYGNQVLNTKFTRSRHFFLSSARLMHAHLLCFRSGVALVAVYLWYDVTSLGNRFPTFRCNEVVSSSKCRSVQKCLLGHSYTWRWNHYCVSKSREPITQWCDVMSQKKGNLVQMQSMSYLISLSSLRLQNWNGMSVSQVEISFVRYSEFPVAPIIP
jgi:hypothetical protein